jgi:hypothetical protein
MPVDLDADNSKSEAQRHSTQAAGLIPRASQNVLLGMGAIR